MALETVGTSAYSGAAQLLENKDTLTEAAVSIFSSYRYAKDVLTKV